MLPTVWRSPSLSLLRWRFGGTIRGLINSADSRRRTVSRSTRCCGWPRARSGFGKRRRTEPSTANGGAPMACIGAPSSFPGPLPRPATLSRSTTRRLRVRRDSPTANTGEMKHSNGVSCTREPVPATFSFTSTGEILDPATPESSLTFCLMDDSSPSKETPALGAGEMVGASSSRLALANMQVHLRSGGRFRLRPTTIARQRTWRQRRATFAVDRSERRSRKVATARHHANLRWRTSATPATARGGRRTDRERLRGLFAETADCLPVSSRTP